MSIGIVLILLKLNSLFIKCNLFKDPFADILMLVPSFLIYRNYFSKSFLYVELISIPLFYTYCATCATYDISLYDLESYIEGHSILHHKTCSGFFGQNIKKRL